MMSDSSAGNARVTTYLFNSDVQVFPTHCCLLTHQPPKISAKAGKIADNTSVTRKPLKIEKVYISELARYIPIYNKAHLNTFIESCFTSNICTTLLLSRKPNM